MPSAGSRTPAEPDCPTPHCALTGGSIILSILLLYCERPSRQCVLYYPLPISAINLIGLSTPPRSLCHPMSTSSHPANGPIDLDRQCGVINDKNLPCSRSLTCKTHTVGAKRAVQGRTRPYDSLYLEWQRINNPNFKEPSKPLRRDKDGLPIGQGGGSGSGNGAGHDGSGGMSDKSKNKGMGLGADGKSLSGKKRWIGGVGSGFPSSMKAGAGDEGIQDGEEGQRELEDLIACTKLAGERVRAAIGMLGMSWTASAGTAAQPATGGSAAQAQAQTARKQSKSQAAGSALPSNTQPPAAKESISNPNSNPIPAAGSNGKTVPAPTPASAALPASASASTPITNHNTTRTGTIPFSSTTVWRTASNVNFLGVGETLTKALATRMGNVMMPHHGHGHGHGHSHPGLINVNSHSGSKGVKVRPGQNQGSGQGQAQGQGMKIQMPSAMVSGTGMGDGLAGVGVGAGGGGGGGGGGQALYPVVVS